MLVPASKAWGGAIQMDSGSPVLLAGRIARHCQEPQTQFSRNFSVLPQIFSDILELTQRT